MFGFLKPKPAPEGPVAIAGNLVIEKPAEEVYRLLDLADPNYSWRQRGAAVEPVEGEPGRFTIRVPSLPESTTFVSVTEAMPNQSYACTSENQPMIGRLVRSHERFTLEPLGPGSCRVWLLQESTLIDGMSMREFKHESWLLNAVFSNTLVKLRVQAEQGAEAVMAQDQKLIATG